VGVLSEEQRRTPSFQEKRNVGAGGSATGQCGNAFNCEETVSVGLDESENGQLMNQASVGRLSLRASRDREGRTNQRLGFMGAAKRISLPKGRTTQGAGLRVESETLATMLVVRELPAHKYQNSDRKARTREATGYSKLVAR